MSLRSTIIAAAIAMTLTFAGCVGGGAPSSKEEKPANTVPTGSAVVDESAPAADSGRIYGVVVDDEKVPVAAVKISLQETLKEVLTNEEGAFEFTGVPFGVHTVFSSRLGYEAGSPRKVELSADTPEVKVELTLVAIVIVEEHHLTTTYVGKISCGILLVPVCGIAQDLPVNPTQETWIFEWAYDGVDAPVEMVTETVWQPSVPGTAQALIPTILVDGDIVQSLSGPSPVRFVSDEDQLKDWFKKEKQIGVYPELADPVVDQKFTIYRTDFWGAPSPANWTYVPE